MWEFSYHVGYQTDTINFNTKHHINNERGESHKPSILEPLGCWTDALIIEGLNASDGAEQWCFDF